MKALFRNQIPSATVDHSDQQAAYKTLKEVGDGVAIVCGVAWGISALLGGMMLPQAYGAQILLMGLLASIGGAACAIGAAIPLYHPQLRTASAVLFILSIGAIVVCFKFSQSSVEVIFCLALFAEAAVGLIAQHLHYYGKRHLES